MYGGMVTSAYFVTFHIIPTMQKLKANNPKTPDVSPLRLNSITVPNESKFLVDLMFFSKPATTDFYMQK